LESGRLDDRGDARIILKLIQLGETAVSAAESWLHRPIYFEVGFTLNTRVVPSTVSARSKARNGSDLATG
jgi:hypothetical protein